MPTALAYESARGNMHGVLALYHRRGIEMEGYAEATDAVAVRRGSINREVARLDTGRLHWSADADNKISHLGKNSAVTGRLGTDHCTLCLTSRW